MKKPENSISTSTHPGGEPPPSITTADSHRAQPRRMGGGEHERRDIKGGIGAREVHGGGGGLGKRADGLTLLISSFRRVTAYLDGVMVQEGKLVGVGTGKW